MELSAFDGRYVRIVTKADEIFDGQCVLDCAEYCMHELGREEEALEIDHWVFYKSDIREIKYIEEDGDFLWLNRPLHRMRLDCEPFDKIDSGKKTIELRLYDEKRRRIRVGDAIRFECTLDEDAAYVEVKALHVFPSFKELYRTLPLTACGYEETALADAKPEDMDRYYSREEQEKYGVVGIEIGEFGEFGDPENEE